MIAIFAFCFVVVISIITVHQYARVKPLKTKYQNSKQKKFDKKYETSSSLSFQFEKTIQFHWVSNVYHKIVDFFFFFFFKKSEREVFYRRGALPKRCRKIYSYLVTYIVMA